MEIEMHLISIAHHVLAFIFFWFDKFILISWYAFFIDLLVDLRFTPILYWIKKTNEYKCRQTLRI